MRQEIIDLYDEFTHRGMDRRLFMQRLSELAGGTAAATAALSMLRSNYAKAAVIAPDDSRLKGGHVSFAGQGGREVAAYLAKPTQGPDKRGSVIVIHQNRGLNPHIEDVARRVAIAGFDGLAPDLLTAMGGTPLDDEQRAMDMIAKLDMPGVVGDVQGAVSWLMQRPDSNGKVGIVGFCWGGGVVGQAAVAEPRLAAGVVYYGLQPTAEQVKNIKAPLLLNY